MDINKLNSGEKLAGVAGIALLLIMFIFDWFTVDAGFGFEFGGNAWDTMELIRFILLLASISAIALAVTAASQTDVDLPVALSAITAGLGILSVVLIAFRIISPPDGGAGDLVDVGRGIGVFLGLIAAGGVAAGGWMAMQEEGASFTGPPSGGTAPPPPPPPPPAHSPPPPPAQ